MTAFRVSRTGPCKDSSHYRTGDIEPIDLIVSMNLDFLTGNLIKYACRAPYKNQTMSDLLKAKQYLDWLIEIEQNKAIGGVH